VFYDTWPHLYPYRSGGPGNSQRRTPLPLQDYVQHLLRRGPPFSTDTSFVFVANALLKGSLTAEELLGEDFPQTVQVLRQLEAASSASALL
jgi:hypothetical protein